MIIDKIYLISKMAVKIILLLAATVLLSSVHCNQDEQNTADPTQQVDKIVLLTNHFYSEEVTSTSYNITELITDKPLLFYLLTQDPEANNKTLRNNMIFAQFEGGSDMDHLHC